MDELLDRIEKKVTNELEKYLDKEDLDMMDLKCLVHIWKDMKEVE